MAGYPQVVSPPPGMMRGNVGYSPMSPPPMPGYAQGYQQQAAMGFAPMPGYGAPQGMPAMASRNPQQFATPPHHSPVPTGATQQKGTLRPGQEIRVGKQVVVVEKYLSEGGYAHVYLTRSQNPIGLNRLKTHCLKRIAFRDDQGTDMLKETEKEIQVMKALKGNDRIVEYLDSEMKRLESRREGGPGWEVFILMEFCGGGGIIDLLNKRLRDRLREDEILTIFADVCEAVAHMHTLSQPLLHRDLKIENILCTPATSSGSSSSSSISSFRYKLCDFGSTTYPALHAPRSKREAEALAYDLNRHTTLQYRSPEMVEPLLGLPVGLPADVWALGVLLYKLCYYTTPFEEHGPLAIVNAKYTFPAYPVYSPVLQHLIAAMLVEQPTRRPTVVDMLTQVHRLRGTRPDREYPNPDSKVGFSGTERAAPSPAPAAPATGNLLDFRSQEDVVQSRDSPSSSQTNLVSNIQPQRRGRPTKAPATAASRPSVNEQPASAQPVPTFRIQVTGDGQQQPPAAKPNLVNDIKRFAADFGDSFAPDAGLITPAAETAKKSSLGFDDGFDGNALATLPASEPLTKARTTSPVPSSAQTVSSGFGDSFAPAKLGEAGRQTSSKTISLPVPSDMKSSTPAVLSPSSEHSSAFEDRFPSVEQLAAREGSGSEKLLVKSPEMMSKPLRPSFGRQSSSEVNTRGLSFHQPSITGGAADENQKMRLLSIDEPPHARSTHVTGSAFKFSEGTEPSRKQQPSFDLLGSISTDSGPSARPTPSQSQDSEARSQLGFQQLGDSSPSTTKDREQPRVQADEQDLLVTSPVAGEPSTARQSSLPKDLLTGGNNRSFDDYGYAALLPSGQQQAGGRKPPPVNVKPARLGTQSAQGQPPNSAPIQDGTERSPVSAGVSKARPLPTKPDHLRRLPGTPTKSAGSRVPPSSYSPVSPARVSTPPVSGIANDASKENSGFGGNTGDYPTRPAAISRRSSINEMVAKYESLSSPRLESEGFDTSSAPSRTRGQTVPKPAPKPVQLKAGNQAQGAGIGAEEQAEGGSGSGLGRSRSMFLPGDTPRRRLTPEPSSASGRMASEVPSPTGAETNGGGGGGNKGVNALIARWNQGTVPAQGTHPSAAKARAPLGSGRRL